MSECTSGAIGWWTWPCWRRYAPSSTHAKVVRPCSVAGTSGPRVAASGKTTSTVHVPTSGSRTASGWWGSVLMGSPAPDSVPRQPVRVHLVDPSAFTPPYDGARAAALARAGDDVTLVTSRFAYGEVPAAAGYAVHERFYRRAGSVGGPGSRARLAAKLAEHVPDMVAYRRDAPRAADVVHFQWLTVQP